MTPAVSIGVGLRVIYGDGLVVKTVVVVAAVMLDHLATAESGIE